MSAEKEYELNIDPRILELLGPNLYTNIYYVLAELIANAYDAEAHNVYIISHPDRIIVEDDGMGMSYYDNDIKKYLNVASESRVKRSNLERRKMGRKGVGKLAALSVSTNVYVKTIKNNDKSGFILSRFIDNSKKLTSLPDSTISFEYISDHGTAIEMLNPEYRFPKSLETLKRNLLKMFPLVDDGFKIHLIRGNEQITIESFENEIISQLGTLIILGEDFKELSKFFKCDFPSELDRLYQARPAHNIPVAIENRSGEEEEYIMEIHGWIGTYRSTKGRKRTVTDFPDNFISLYANKKLGEFNVLPIVGQNKLNEVYVVGQLHIDLFEETELPDMSLSNRQGYKTDDLRYKLATEYIRDTLLQDILKFRETFISLKKKASQEQKWDERKRREEEFKKNVEQFKQNTSKSVADKISTLDKYTYKDILSIVNNELGTASKELGLKTEIDIHKKKILISHTKRDKDISDIIYNMLLFNGVPSRDILYTNCDNENARIPEGKDIYDYLKSFFVESISTQKIYAIYVTSSAMGTSWGAISEVGAGWITEVNHKIFNIGNFTPGHPLDDSTQWLQAKRHNKDIYLDNINHDVFCIKIEAICKELGYPYKSRAENKLKLSEYISIIKTDDFIELP